MNANVSVIIPAYNAQTYIEKCIASVTAQTYRDIEILVINDGSTDQTGAIVQRLASADPRIRYIATENRGVSAARNCGLEHAAGRYILFLDADDMLCEDAVASMLEKLQNTNSDCCIAFTDSTVQGKPDTLEQEQLLLHCLADMPISYTVWGKLYSAESIRNIRFPENCSIHEDSGFIFEYATTKPRCVILKKPVILRHRHTTSLSASASPQKALSILTVLEYKSSLLEERFPELAFLLPGLQLTANMALLRFLLKSFDRKYHKQQLACIRAVCANRQYADQVVCDRKWLFVITHHLYSPYKILFHLHKRLPKPIKKSRPQKGR